MANRNLRGTMFAGLAPDETRRASIRTNQSNWLRSIVAGIGMLAVSSLVVVLVFDWYLFSVVDGLANTLRPIAGAFHHPGGDAQTLVGGGIVPVGHSIRNITPNGPACCDVGSSRSAANEDPVSQHAAETAKSQTGYVGQAVRPPDHLPEDFAIPPEKHRDRAGIESLFAPVRSAANPTTPAN